MKAGVLIRFWSFWIGVHYSKTCKRICINVIPCVTIWITLKGGMKPEITKM